MKKTILLLLLLCFLSCADDKTSSTSTPTNQAQKFNKSQWQEKRNNEYTYREKMYLDVLYNDTIRKLSKKEILTLLGKPTKTVNNHYYYLISEKKLGFFVLHQKHLVIKFKDSTNIEWIKVHE